MVSQHDIYPIKLNTMKKETRQHNMNSAYARSLVISLKSGELQCNRNDAAKAKIPKQQNKAAKKELKG